MVSKSILVKGINNLSDARYCAGMGVDFVAFELNPSDSNYLEPKKIKEIKNWLVGLEIGVRLTDCKEVSLDTIKEIQPSFVIVGEEQFNQGDFSNNVFVESSMLLELPDSINLLWQTTQEELSKDLENLKESIFVDLTDGPEAIKEILESDFKGGLVLNGGNETRPGFSDYGDLMDILELLDD